MDSEGQRILLVDDNDDVRDALSLILEREGYGVTHARNGFDALSLLENGEEPCLILLDLHMPVMDGLAFRAVQLSEPRWAHIPVVIYSGHYDVPGIAKRLQTPYYFSKPLNLDALVALAERHCNPGRPAFLH